MGKLLVLITITAALLILGGCLQPTGELVACTADAKICPDGSAVGRVGPDCEFAPCPSASTNTPPPQHYPETPTPTFQPFCVEGEMKNATCPDGVTTYFSENCVDGEWVQVKYIRDPCAPLPTNSPDNGERIWLEYEPVQCLGNPWEQDWLASQGNDYSAYPREQESDVITDYYEKQGITIFDVKIEPRYEVVCMACSCPRGDMLYLRVSGRDVDRMIELGFRPTAVN